MDYEKLAYAIITEWESDREESGRKELADGMRYLLTKYTSEYDLSIIGEVLMTLTGWTLSSLIQMAASVSDEHLEEL